MRLPSVSSSAVVVACRILLVGMAGGALALGLLARRAAVDPPAAVSYACPMHPNVTSSTPGDCPICRMALEAVPERPAHAAAGSEESQSFVLPVESSLRRWGETDRVGRYEISLEMRAPARAESAETGMAVFHRDEGDVLQPDEEGAFYPSSPPRDGVAPGIKVHTIGEPTVREADPKTVEVRFRVDRGAMLVPDQTGTVKLATRIRNDLVVRASAIVEAPAGPYVLVVDDDWRTLTKRTVEIGNVLYGYAAVISGLAENEPVVTNHTRFLDAERRFRGGTP